MEPTHDPQPPAPAAPAVPLLGELLLDDERFNETPRRLPIQPLTLIGRSAGCDVRLKGQGISGLHCALLHDPAGRVVLRDLQSAGGTLVNGLPVATQVLRDGDVLSVGPYRLRVQLAPAAGVKALPAPAPAAAAVERERSALRIQTAAVAAQQIALTEEETRLQQRRVALERQEEQLAAHLEEKRRRLVDLQDQVRAARAALRGERTAYEADSRALLQQLARDRQELADLRHQTHSERRRLVELRRRLKRRWHRHWAAERAAQRRREAALRQQRRALYQEGERLKQGQTALVQAQLRFNGDSELGRRQLQAAWDRLRQERRHGEERRAREEAELRRRARELDRREAALGDAADDLAEQTRQWEAAQLRRHKESEGLENRIRNLRRKLLDQEQEVARLDAVLRSRLQIGTQEIGNLHSAICNPEEGARPSGSTANPSPPVAPPAAGTPCLSAVFTLVDVERREARLREARLQFQQRVRVLERLAAELADQRLDLAQQGERLVRAQQRWREEQADVAAELEAAWARLQEREHALWARAQDLEAAEHDLRRRREEVGHLRLHLEGGKARLAARLADWEAERDRLLTSARAREELADRHLAAVADLRQRLEERYQQAFDQLGAERSACLELRQECAALWHEWHHRTEVLSRQERAVAERALALEQYRQECLGQAVNPPVAAKRLERLRRRWAGVCAAAERDLERERRALQAEALRLEGHYRQMQRQAEALARRQKDFATRQATWEEQHLLTAAEHAKLRLEVQSLQAHRACYERQLAEVRSQVEHVAGLLLDEADTPALPAVQAA